MTTSEERKQMASISGLTQPPGFKKKPTLIELPRNEPAAQNPFYSRAGGLNPYQQAHTYRMGSSSVGNVTSGRTLIRGLSGQDDQGPPTKRRKIEVSDHASRLGQGRHRLLKSSIPRPPLAPEIIDSDYDIIEETPSRVAEFRSSRRQSSPDELNISPYILNSPRQPSRSDFMRPRMQGSEKNKPTIIVPDGEHTKWAQIQFKSNDDDLDPIEGSSDRPFPSSSHTPQNKTISYGEDKAYQKIDLASRQKKIPGVAKNMKGKNPLRNLKSPAALKFEPALRNYESLATSSTSQKNLSFSVKEAYLDDQFYPVHAGQKLEMYWNADVLRMKASEVEVFKISLSPEYCKSFIDSYSEDIPPLIQLKSTDGTLATIRLDSDYDAVKYDKVKSKMRMKPESVSTHSLDTLWEYAVRAANGSIAKQSEKMARLDSLRFGQGSAPYPVDRKRKALTVPPSNPLPTGPPNSSSRPVESEIASTPSKPRRGTRQETNILNVRRSTRNAPAETTAVADELILVYPPGPGAVNINMSDLSRLAPGEYLNDTLIEFGLKLWLRDLEEDNPALASQIHIFNSFFYKKLNHGKDVQQTFASVRKWTSKFDIFEKKYIIVPINEHLHWYLAIICEPGHILSPRTPNPSVARKQTRSTAQAIAKADSPAPLSDDKDDQNVTSSEAEVERNLNNDFQSSCKIENDDIADPEPPVNVRDDDDGEVSSTAMSYVTQTVEGDEASGLSNDRRSVSSPELKSPGRSPSVSSTGMVVDSIEEIDAPPNQDAISTDRFYSLKSRKGKERAQSESDILTVDDLVDGTVSDGALQQTYIFIMDSLGTRHPQAVKKLSQYLIMEAKDKKGILEAGSAVGRFASVPVQPNFCDCGVYLLHFAQTFMSDPLRYTKGILSQPTKSIPNKERQKTWKDSQVANMRETLAMTIHHLSGTWKRTKTNESHDDDDDEVMIVEQDTKKGTKGTKDPKGAKNTSKTTTAESPLTASSVKTRARRLR